MPLAAPGEAGRPRAMARAPALGSRRGNSSCSSISGWMRSSAWRLSIRPSCTISTEVRTSAVAFILPLRVCRQYSVPFSMGYS